jgi:glycosyltransferase involved in cell wall biosynthesis
VGNLIPRKRLDVALHALAALPERVAALTVVGDAGPDPAHAAALTRLAARLGIAGRVTFRGRLSDPALRDEFEQSHLLVVPSDYEGFGIVYLEGMAAGLPAIATSSGAAHEVISDGINGFLIPPGDRVKLALLIQDLADDRDRLAEMSRAALDRFRSHPAWETSMDQARQFLLSLTG